MKNLRRKIPAFIITITLIVLGYFSRDKLPLNVSSEVMNLITIICFLISLVISLRFNRNKEFFILIILGLSFLILNYTIKSRDNYIGFLDIYFIISVLIPINIGIFSTLKDRGIISLWGILKIVFILFQIILCLYLVTVDNVNLLNKVNINGFKFGLKTSGTANLLFILISLMFIGKSIYDIGTKDIYFLGILISTFVGLNSMENNILYFIYFTLIPIISMVGILQDSYSMAFTDELTTLPSRRSLKQDMLKLGTSYSIAMVDIDHFKKFNDKYGHDVGDDVLKLVADIIRKVNGGKAYRYGGEEFTILFPNKDIKTVLPELEEIRKEVETTGFLVKNKNNKKITKKVKLTISIGVSQKNETNKKADMVLKAADKCLYKAKNKGRNCVCK